MTAIGTYQRTSREISLLNKNQKESLSHMGTNLSTAIGNEVQQGAANLQQQWMAFVQSPEFAQMMQDPQLQAVLAQNPQLAQMLSNPAAFQQIMGPYLEQASTAFNGMLT